MGAHISYACRSTTHPEAGPRPVFSQGGEIQVARGSNRSERCIEAAYIDATLMQVLRSKEITVIGESRLSGESWGQQTPAMSRLL